MGGQDIILDAAIEAKVKRFLPSDYGIDCMNALDTQAGQSLEGRAKTIQHLKDLAQKHTWFSWTGLAVGLFFDWVRLHGKGFHHSGNSKRDHQGLRFELLGFDMVNHAATIIDSGKEPFSASNLATLGQAATAILRHPEETANRTVKVSSFTTTQNEVLELLEARSGAKWKINKVSGEDLEKLGDEKKQTGDPLFFALYLQRYIFSDGANTAWKDGQTDNRALDLEMEEEIQDTVSRVLSEYSSPILPS